MTTGAGPVSGAHAPAESRTLAPPERRSARVRGVERLGAYGLITALDELGPPDPRPGQFYMLATAAGWGAGADERPYLPRAFSYARARPTAAGLELSFLLEAIGPGTERLARLRPEEELALVGPLGNGWRAAAAGTRPLLVGGGIGVAPLLCLHDELPEATVLLGFRSAPHAEAARLFGEPATPGEPARASGDRAKPPERRSAAPVVVGTDDGSAGRRAFVTELLGEELDREPAATVLACGPPAMLEAVRAACAERDVPAQLALESGMACGFGACFGCVVPTRAGYVRLCVDGPVLDADGLETALAGGAGH